MAVISQLAHSLGRRDEVPNQDLAKEIAASGEKVAVKELVANLHHKTKGIQHDCIKVLYEIGLINPGLIAEYLPQFLLLLRSNNNRMQWGGMAAINSITLHSAKAVYAALPQVIAAADEGSVITRDHAVFILIKLCTEKTYAPDAFELLVDQLRNCPANQLPMYAERAVTVITVENKHRFRETIAARLPGMETGSKRRRIEKVLEKIAGITAQVK